MFCLFLLFAPGLYLTSSGTSSQAINSMLSTLSLNFKITMKLITCTWRDCYLYEQFNIMAAVECSYYLI
jgi:hypothetical protein